MGAWRKGPSGGVGLLVGAGRAFALVGPGLALGAIAGTLQATPGLSVGPESADVVTVPFAPASEARIVVADALAGRRGLPYTLTGSADATPEDAKVRSFDIDTRNTLTPVPGLDGVLR